MVAHVVRKGHSLGEAFGEDAAQGQSAALEPRDQALARSIALAALRRLGTIRKGLARFLERGLPKRVGDLEWHLVVGAAQVLFLDVPDHAAVDLAVHAARSAKGSEPFAALTNAVLRNFVRHREAILTAGDPLEDDTPAWLAQKWKAEFGEATARRIAAANRAEPTLDLTVRSDPQRWAQQLGGIVLPTGSVRLRTHTPIAELAGYAEGEWWVQDAAAALVARLVEPKPGENIADVCAAPGGKTAVFAAAGARVVAIDRSAPRLQRLRANLARLDLQAETVEADLLAYEGGPFDAVLLDAPCSATGTIRRHPDVAWAKRSDDIAKLVVVQAALLDRSLALLRPGGRLVYCTCSLEPEEGWRQIAALLERHRDVERLPIDPREIFGLAECLTAEGDLRTLPFHLPGSEPRLSGLDGFFAGRVLRHG